MAITNVQLKKWTLSTAMITNITIILLTVFMYRLNVPKLYAFNVISGVFVYIGLTGTIGLITSSRMMILVFIAGGICTFAFSVVLNIAIYENGLGWVWGLFGSILTILCLIQVILVIWYVWKGIVILDETPTLSRAASDCSLPRYQPKEAECPPYSPHPEPSMVESHTVV